MFPKRLRSFARLARDERRLALRALGWLLFTRAALRLLPFRTVRAWLEVPEPAAATEKAVHEARAVRRAVRRASRTLPGTTCLAEALVAARLLRRAGHGARLSLGAARGVGGTRALDAHAWVESAGVLVTGDDPRGRYETLARSGGA